MLIFVLSLRGFCSPFSHTPLVATTRRDRTGGWIASSPMCAGLPLVSTVCNHAYALVRGAWTAAAGARIHHVPLVLFDKTETDPHRPAAFLVVCSPRLASGEAGVWLWVRVALEGRAHHRYFLQVAVWWGDDPQTRVGTSNRLLWLRTRLCRSSTTTCSSLV